MYYDRNTWKKNAITLSYARVSNYKYVFFWFFKNET